MCRGSYRLRPTLPATPGAECLGRVTAVGAGVVARQARRPGHQPAAGELGPAAAREGRRRHPGAAGIDVLQGAMLRINPPTALLLLTDIVALKPGDWVVQNVANSAVGRLVITLARARGIKTVNVVRRESLFAELDAARRRCLRGRRARPGRAREGADRRRADPARSRRGLGPGHGAAVGVRRRGRRRLQLRLDERRGPGDVAGGADRQRPDAASVSSSAAAWPPARSREIRALYADLGEQVQKGVLSAPVEKVYPIEEIRHGPGARAARRAQRQDPGRPERAALIGSKVTLPLRRPAGRCL